jgi:hypothetical protein
MPDDEILEVNGEGDEEELDDLDEDDEDDPPLIPEEDEL